MGDIDTFEDLGPGLHAFREADPDATAQVMVATIHARLCTTSEEAEALLTELRELPVVDAATIASLRVLARRVGRAERIAARTRDRALVEVGHRLSSSVGLAVHPTTIRERAATLVAARAAVEAAERALVDHTEGEPASGTPSATQSDRAAEVTAGEGSSPGAPRRRGPSGKTRQARAVGAIVASFGLLLILLGLRLTPLWAALLLPLAASLWASRYLRPVAPDTAGEAEASSLLAEVSASTDKLFGTRQTEWEQEQRGMQQQAVVDTAIEELRVAQRAWHDLAGADTDVSELEAVVKRFECQHGDAPALAADTPEVRATEVVGHQLRQRWLALWSELGLTAPEMSDAEQAVEELAAQLSRPVVLMGAAAAQSSEVARRVPAAAVVVLECPSGGDALS